MHFAVGFVAARERAKYVQAREPVARLHILRPKMAEIAKTISAF
jgi:hypothetical protein